MVLASSSRPDLENLQHRLNQALEHQGIQISKSNRFLSRAHQPNNTSAGSQLICAYNNSVRLLLISGMRLGSASLTQSFTGSMQPASDPNASRGYYNLPSGRADAAITLLR